MQTFTRLYDSHSQARQAVQALEEAGVPSKDISLVANPKVDEKYAGSTTTAPASSDDDTSGGLIGAGVGAAIGGGAGLLAGLGLLAIPGLGPVVAAGWLASLAVGAVAGSAAGGLIGALVDAGVTEEDAHVYSEAVRRGGTLLTVRTDFSAEEVEEILDEYDPVDPSTRRREYEEAGWKGYDPDAEEYEFDEDDVKRMRRA